jgi:hypothetical protein
MTFVGSEELFDDEFLAPDRGSHNYYELDNSKLRGLARLAAFFAIHPFFSHQLFNDLSPAS